MKIFAIFTTFIILGVVFVGATITGEMVPGYKKGCILVEGNASFLAPIPVNYTLIKTMPFYSMETIISRY